MVGFVHSPSPYAHKVTNALVNIVVNNAFNTRHAIALHGQHGR